MGGSGTFAGDSIIVTAGLPIWWVFGEGVFTVAAGVLTLVLWNSVRKSLAAGAGEIAE